MSSTPAKGLFQGAIAQSAPIALPWIDRTVGSQILTASASAVGCNNTSEADLINCLRQLSTDVFIGGAYLNATYAATAQYEKVYDNATSLTSAVEPFIPTVGTGVIDGQFKPLLESGKLPSAGIPLMIGNCRDEADLFLAVVPQLANPLPASVPLLDEILAVAFPPKVYAAIVANQSVFALNTSDSDALRDDLGNIVTLDTWQCPLQSLLTTASSQKTFSSLYSYRFDYAPVISPYLPAICLPNNQTGIDHVCHSEDVPVVFGLANIAGIPQSAADLQYTRFVMDSWGSFFRSYDPNVAPAYLQARGYNYTQSVAFDQFPSIFHYALELNSTGLVYTEQCSVLEGAGFLYDMVNSS